MSAIGRLLCILHTTVANWLNKMAEKLPQETAEPVTVALVDLIELHTFVEKKALPLCLSSSLVREW